MTQPKIPFQQPNGNQQPKAPTTEETLAAISKQLEALATANGALVRRIEGLEKPKAAPKAPAKQEEAQSWRPSEEELSEDPVGSIERMVRENAAREIGVQGAPIAATAFNVAINQHHEEVKRLNKGLYDFLKADLDDFVTKNNIPDNILATKFPDGSTGVSRAFEAVVGKNFGKVMEALKKLPAEAERTEVPFVEGATPRADLRNPDGLSAAEAQVARTLGIKPEDYVAARKESIVTTPERT